MDMLPEGEFCYEVEIQGFFIPSLNINLSNPISGNIEALQSTSSFTEIRIQLRTLASQEELRKIAYSLVEKFLEFVILEFAKDIFKLNKPVLKWERFLQLDEGNFTSISAGMKINPNNISSIVSPSEKQLDDFKVNLTDKLGKITKITLLSSNSAPIYLDMFKACLQIENFYVRYLFLYSILGTIAYLKGYKPGQGAVDQLILAIEPNTPKTKNHHNNRLETLYTRLRNELAHADDRIKRSSDRPTEKLAKVFQEIDECRSEFQQLVSKAILTMS